MGCPKCGQKFKIYSFVFSKNNNFRTGFFCPNCDTRLRAVNSFLIEEKYDIIKKILVPVLLFFSFVSTKYLQNKPYGLIIMVILFGGTLFYVAWFFANFLERSIKLEIDDNFKGQKDWMVRVVENESKKKGIKVLKTALIAIMFSLLFLVFWILYLNFS